MEFKFRAIDGNNIPPTTSNSLSPVTYIPDQSLQLNASFSGLRMPLSGDAALRREIEKEQIRREILRRMELEEEVRTELAMEKELGISIPRPLMNMQGLMSHWLNSAVMNPAAVAHIDPLQPLSILPPAEITPSLEIGNKDKVIVLDKPDPDLFNAKRKATTPPVSEVEPPAFSSKKKLKEDWSCALCNIKATSESGLKAHLTGKKHKAKEAGQSRMIAKRNKKSGENVMVAETVANTTTLVVDAEKDQQLLQPCTALEVMNETAAAVDKGVEECKKEEQLVKKVADNDASATESKNEKFAATMVGENITELKNEEQLVETMADNSMMLKVKPINENELVEMMVSNDAIKFENGGLLVEKSQNVDSLESVKDAAMEEVEKTSALTKMKNEEQVEETMADNSVMWKVKPINENELVEMMVSNDDIKFENGGLEEKSQNVGSLDSKKDAAVEEAEKTNASTKRSKVEPLWCEICQINTFSKAVMEGHVKGKKHIKKMKKFGQINASPPSTSSVSS